MTTNIFESLNFAMLKAWELSKCSILEVLQMMLQRWFFERRNEELILPKPLKVNPVNNMNYHVIDETSQYVIYLPTKNSFKNGVQETALNVAVVDMLAIIAKDASFLY
uniref:Uncharacterized protein n=1 Tax=Cucumis melo TaxID=3656 RepID=A0A9I9EEB2_CUCME